LGKTSGIPRRSLSKITEADSIGIFSGTFPLPLEVTHGRQAPFLENKGVFMKTRAILILVMVLAVTGGIFADLADDVMSIFNDFLGRLTARQAALETLPMPDIEVRGVTGAEDINQSAVILSFESLNDAETFAAALQAENIPYGSFGESFDILLFSIDMMIFVMQDAIGL
jgi:hypothetical protein